MKNIINKKNITIVVGIALLLFISIFTYIKLSSNADLKKENNTPESKDENINQENNENNNQTNQDENKENNGSNIPDDNNSGNNNGNQQNNNGLNNNEQKKQLSPEEVIINSKVEGTFNNNSNKIIFVSSTGEFLLNVDLCENKIATIFGDYKVDKDRVVLTFKANQYTGYDSSKNTTYELRIINSNQVMFNSTIGDVCGPNKGDYFNK